MTPGRQLSNITYPRGLVARVWLTLCATAALPACGGNEDESQPSGNGDEAVACAYGDSVELALDVLALADDIRRPVDAAVGEL